MTTLPATGEHRSPTPEPRPFTLQPGTTALVLDSPHSGTQYPADFGHACARAALRVAEDTHVDRLWDFAPALGASLVCANFPRTYIDANRALDEIDPLLLTGPWSGPVNEASAKVRLGKGLVWRLLDDGTPLYARRLSPQALQARIDRCWQPYHDAVAQAVQAAAQRHGFVVHLNCHSMPSVADRFSTDHPGLVHPDIVLGDRDGTTADPQLTQWMAQFLARRGLSVNVNHPYKGVELVRRHGCPPARQHAIQLEVNKRLYMDERTLEITAGYARLRATLRELVQALLGWDGNRPAGTLPA